MDRLEQWRELLEQHLQYHADLPYRYGKVETYVLVSRVKPSAFQKGVASPSGNRNHFMLVREGWDGPRRIHGCIVHAEIRNGKIWMHYDGIEDSITEDLVAAGVPKDCIVLAFHPPEVREHTGYAIA